MHVQMESKLATFGLRQRHLIALTLLRDLGESSQADLAGTLKIDRTNLVGLLNDLESSELIERRRSREDRRRHTVALTPTGRQKLADAECALAAVEGEVLSGLTVKQRARLYDLLQKATGGAGEPYAERPAPDG